MDVPAPAVEPREPAEVGIDLGAVAVAALSTGALIPAPRAGLRAARRVARRQRIVARRKRRSNRRRKAVALLARARDHEREVRRDRRQTLARDLVCRFTFTAVEDLGTCGHRDNADVNAAKNILRAGRARQEQPSCCPRSRFVHGAESSRTSSDLAAAHVETLSPRPAESVAFFRELLGFEESGRRERSVYLRCWGESFHHSLVVTEASQPGLGHVSFRTDGPRELEEAAAAIERLGLGDGWIEGDLGHGRAFRFHTPAGHRVELFWEVERYQAPPHLRSAFPNRPQRYPGRNGALRRIDHVTVQARDVKATRSLFCDVPGFRFMEGFVLPDGTEAFVAITSGAHNHDLAIAAEPPEHGVDGRLHHVAFYHDTREEVLRTADILAEHGYALDYGPSRHGIGEAFFSYVIEPGGNRVEIYSGGYLNYEPDWKPVLWGVGERSVNAWSEDQVGPPSYRGYAMPPLPSDNEYAAVLTPGRAR